jgi:hypothetical protein
MELNAVKTTMLLSRDEGSGFIISRFPVLKWQRSGAVNVTAKTNLDSVRFRPLLSMSSRIELAAAVSPVNICL